MPTQQQITDRLHVRAFHAFWHKLYADERDPVIRFGKAIVASAQPIRDREAFEKWMQEYGGDVDE
ncbi:MAG TPA: hypothetical protein VM223_25405 [Planctomycetota bacterium]|nr:hypothetical protein [Planctomycetota bacterium]